MVQTKARDSITMIEHVRQQERERCAKLAETFYQTVDQEDAPVFRMKVVGECIATDIRKLKD